MATHNQVRLIGYILNEPKIVNEGKEGEEKVVFQMRTTRRKIDDFYEDQYADIIILYDSTELINKFKGFKKFDIVDIKGVLNILPITKKQTCPMCGKENLKYTVSTFVYPISATRMGSYLDYYNEVGESPDALLYKNYRENSNQILILGNVVTEPETIQNGKNSVKCCRYGLGVDRKYFIKTQTDKHADYPWVYSYGEQAELDAKKLIRYKSEILIDGFVHNKKVSARMTCENCGCEFSYHNIVTQVTPYSIEYLSGYKTDEMLAREEENRRREKLSQ